MNPTVRNGRLRQGHRFLVLAFVAGAPCAHAADTTFGLGYSLERSDNIRLVPQGEEEEWINTASVSYGFQENSAVLEGSVRGSAKYRDYRHDIFSDESVFGLNANLIWKIVPQRFTWTLEDIYTQTSVRSLEPDTPDNRQDTNVLSTGPDLLFQIGPADSLQVGARYTYNSFETSDLDNARNTGSVKWIHVASPITTLILNYEVEAVDFDNETLNPNYDREDVFLQISMQRSRNLILLEGGATSIRRDRAEDVDGSRQSFSWTRELTPTTTFNLSASSQLSDVARETRAVAVVEDPSIPGNIVSSDVFRSKKADLVLTHRRGRGSDVLRLFRHEDDFQASVSDEIRRGGNINIGYDITPDFTAEVFNSIVKVENSGLTPVLEYKDTSAGLRLSNRLTRSVNLGLEFMRNKRKSDGLIPIYEENRALLSLDYTSTSRPSR